VSRRVLVALALGLAVGLAFFVSPYASSSPDGLNRVAGDKGFGGRAQVRTSPIRGYAFPGIENERLAKGVAGFVGTLGVFTVGYGAAFALRRRRDAGSAGRAPASA
jgi:PDGLE domain-containing protein